MAHQITFKQYRVYCLKAQKSLNEVEGFKAEYRISKNPLLKDHDGQYLEVTYSLGQTYIKMNLCYSIAFEIPTFYFMVYKDCQPLSGEQIYQQFMHKGEMNQELHPTNEAKGIYLSQNVINKQYFFTLHHCDLQLTLNYLIPFYFSLLGLHPPLIINQEDPIKN